MRTVSQRTGLSPHVIRAWEKRYSTLQPVRSQGNQRRYTEADVERLQRLSRLIQSGYSISQLSAVDDNRLAELESNLTHSPVPPRETSASHRAGHSRELEALLGDAWIAVRAMDSVSLERVLEQGALELGPLNLMEQLIAPLAETIGTEWRMGRLQVAHEHLASATIRSYLSQLLRPYALHESAPTLISTTPAGQIHELGAILVAGTAVNLGWRAVFAGNSLPAEEIARIAQVQSPRAVALSLVHPEDDPQMPAEIRRIRRLLPPTVSILAGGRAANAYATTFAEEGIPLVQGLRQLADHLVALRSDSGKSRSSHRQNETN